MAQPDYRYTTTDIDVQFDSHGIRAWLSCVLDDGKMLLVASENSIHLTRSHRRIRTRSSDDCNRPLVRPYAVRLLQAATAAGSRNPNTAASAQRPAAAHATPSDGELIKHARRAVVHPAFCLHRAPPL